MLFGQNCYLLKETICRLNFDFGKWKIFFFFGSVQNEESLLIIPDPYVKIYLLYNDQRIAKKKTHVKKRTLNPVFNESFVFELPHLGDDGLKHVSLEFMLLDWDRVTKNEVMVM